MNDYEKSSSVDSTNPTPKRSRVRFSSNIFKQWTGNHGGKNINKVSHQNEIKSNSYLSDQHHKSNEEEFSKDLDEESTLKLGTPDSFSNFSTSNSLPGIQYPGLEEFSIIKKMGEGAFSHVYHAIHLQTHEDVAIKVIEKLQLPISQQAAIQKELIIHSKLSHPNIVQLKNHFETDRHYFFCLEFVSGGEIFFKILQLTYFSEELTRHVIVQVAQGIQYLHETVGVVHRDIKPENLLYTSIEFPTHPKRILTGRAPGEFKLDEGNFIQGLGGGGIGKVKIADFGLSKVIWRDGTKTPCGTVGYTAPEIVTSQGYTASVDVWALGCVLYTMLCGFPPFYDEDTRLLTSKVARGEWTFLSPWWNKISDSAKDLVSRLLVFDPKHRCTISDFFNHPWVKNEPFNLPKDQQFHPHQMDCRVFSDDDSTLIDHNRTSSDNFDWNSYELPALKTPATEHMPGSIFNDDPMFDPSNPLIFTAGGLVSHSTPENGLLSPGAKGMKHYFDTSLRAFQELQRRDPLESSENDLGYMEPSSRFNPEETNSAAIFQNSSQRPTTNLTTSTPTGFQLNLNQSGILNKRRSKKGVHHVGFATNGNEEIPGSQSTNGSPESSP